MMQQIQNARTGRDSRRMEKKEEGSWVSKISSNNIITDSFIQLPMPLFSDFTKSPPQPFDTALGCTQDPAESMNFVKQGWTLRAAGAVKEIPGSPRTLKRK